MTVNRDPGSRSSDEQVKSIKLVTNDAVSAQRWVGACAIAHGLRVVSYNERRSRLSTKLQVVVSGHPRYIREFHNDVRGNGWAGGGGGDLLGEILVGAVVSGFRAARRSWQARHDPPLEEDHSEFAVASPQTILFWTWRQQEDGDAVGPVWVETYAPGQRDPLKSEEWPNWARRSEALAYAREHGFVFLPDE